MVTSAPHPPIEGIGFHIKNLERELIQRGHQITVLHNGGVHRAGNPSWGAHCGIHSVPIPPLHVDTYGVFLKFAIRKLNPQPDIVHYHSPLVPHVALGIPNVTTVHSAMSEGIKAMERMHGSFVLSKLVQTLTSTRIEKKLFERTNILATTSRSVSLSVLARPYTCESRKVVQVGNGVDTTFFTPDDADQRDWKSVLWVGRLAGGKGLDELMDLTRRSARSTPHLEFRIAGSGPREPELKKIVDQTGADGNVKLLGWLPREKLRDEYRRAGIFLMTSHYEGMPTVLLEAMSCETACLSNRVGGIPEVIVDDHNGLLVEEGSTDRIWSRLSEVVMDRARLTRIGEAARKTVTEGYSWDRIATRYEGVYREAIGR